jgi:TrmH family RNA methyltransferase
VKPIRSDANPQFRAWLRLSAGARELRAQGRTLAEGLHLAQAALAAALPVEAVLVRGGCSHPQVHELVDRVAGHVPRWELAAALYDRIAPVQNGVGLMLVLPLPEARLPQRADADMVYLDGIQEPGNAGALIRTAAAAGVRHVLAAEGTAALWSPRALRAGMGAHFRVTLHERVAPQDLPQALDGRWLAAVAHDAPSLWDADLGAGALGWIFGSEGAGPGAGALAAASGRVRIPAHSAVESLNVAAAAAVCLFERRRRLWIRSPSPGTPAAP